MKQVMHNAKTGITVEVDLTAEEETQRIIDAEERNVEAQKVEDAKEQKATDKASGNQKLLDLGLSQDEVDALTK